jgi:hypothetical protein
MNLSIDFSNRSYLLVVLSAIILFLALTEWFTRYYIIPIPNTRPFQIHAVYTGHNPNVAIGDSHIYRGFIADDYFLNLGRGGTTIPMMAIMLKQYFKNNRPGNVVIEASPQLFSVPHQRRGTLGYERYFNQNYNFLPFRLYAFEPGIGSHLKRVDSLESIRLIIGEKYTAQRHITLKGTWQDKPHDERVKSMLSSFNWQKPDMDDSTAAEYRAVYKDMIRYLKDRGAKVCMLRTPVEKSYFKYLSKDPDYTRSLALFREIASEETVRYVEFQELDMAFGLDKFLNHDHLSPEASIQFSRLVREACFKDP